MVGFNTSAFSEDIKGSINNPYTVAEILAMTDAESYPEGKQWVEGYCVGAMENAGATVLTLSGQAIYRSTIDEGLSTISVPSKGIYLVKLGNEVKKVII